MDDSDLNVCAGAFFPNARHLVVAGGTFTSHNTTTNVPSDFPRLPLGSIELRHEIRLQGAAAVLCRESRRGRVRRMYSAHVECRNTPVTVALYQGDKAEEDLRHPHILQIYASASSSRVYAAVFHDDMIHFNQFLEYFRYSAILRAYIYAYTCADDEDAWLYYTRFLSTSDLYPIFWIRRSTGRLALELTRIEDDSPQTLFTQGTELLSPPESMITLQHPEQEALVAAALEFPQWFFLCSVYLTQRRSTYISTQAAVKMSSMMYWPEGHLFGDTIEIAWASESHYLCHGWWTSSDAFGRLLYLRFSLDVHPWLSQANHILKQSQIVRNHDDYVLVDEICFDLQISEPRHHPPDGYLFLCSPNDFYSDRTSLRWPRVPAYWSFDPSGRNRLSIDEASSLGFPAIYLSTDVRLASWDASVYSGLRKFHQAKDFDPESQDVARYLGYPLYKLSVPDEDPASERENGVDNPSSDPHVQVESTKCDPLQPTEEFFLP
ncbi:hypothetical protein MSAN_00473100 [Mycena sanguinolenta]|uniref:Uncharacterized protein n=1 Tax=Mycena sanguinolenta TaxID=230812 RepID=A0A8H6ZEB6_9AGAR|nr:hypothetical protein MSAN_00473100 [Mycena sanguinolenta]